MAERPTAGAEPDHGASSGGRNLARRRRVLGAAVVTAIAVSGVGLGASQVIKSPAQAAADTAAPPPSVLTVPVERRVLRDSVIVRGTVTASGTVQVAPSGSGQEGGGSPVVTKIYVRAGDTFRPGHALLEVSGRPVIALKGTLPVYRDLKPGTEGDDVAQLQQALADTGHPVVGDRSGFFGPGTKSALTGLYRSIGYDPLPAEPDSEDTLASAQDAVTDALRHLQDVRTADDSSTAPESLATPDSSATPDEDGRTESSPSPDGKGRTRNPSVDVTRAREDLARAEKKLADAKARSGPMLPSSEVVYLQGFPARVDEVGAAVGSQVSGSVMTVSAGRLVVTGFLSREQRNLVRPGQQVQILSELDGTTARATVRSVADTVTRPQADGQDQDAHSAPADGATQGFAVTVVPDRALPAALSGEDVRLTIQTAATSGKVLVVPVTAISAGADGVTAVTVEEPGDRRRRVPVVTGASGDGYVEVRVARQARLAAGEKVITGIGGAL